MATSHINGQSDSKLPPPRNSSMIAAREGRVWAGNYFSAGYDSDTAMKNGKRASGNWRLYAPHGKKFNAALEAKWQAAYPEAQVSTLARTPCLCFADFEELFKFAAKYLGIKGWKRDKFGGWHPDDKSTQWPCEVRVSRDQGRAPSTFSTCDRAREPEGKCKLHLNADKKAAVRAAKHKEEEEASEAGSKIAQDAVELLKARGIKAAQHYHVPFGRGLGRYTGDVEVHAEDVIALVKRIAALEDILGITQGDAL